MEKFKEIIKNHETFLETKKAEMLLKKEKFDFVTYSSNYWKTEFENILQIFFELEKRVTKLEIYSKK